MRGPLGPCRKIRSAVAARAPMPQTGWMRAGGSPNRRSSSRAAGRRSRADSTLIATPLWSLPGDGCGPLPDRRRYGKEGRPVSGVPGTGHGDEERRSHAGGQEQGKTWAGKAVGQCCACGFLAFFRPWPGRQSAKNRLPVQEEGRLSGTGRGAVTRFHRISRGGDDGRRLHPCFRGCLVNGSIFPAADPWGRPQAAASVRPFSAGNPVGAVCIFLILRLKNKKWEKSKKKLASGGRIL